MLNMTILMLWLQPVVWFLRTIRALAGFCLSGPFLVYAFAKQGFKTPLLTAWAGTSRVPLGKHFFSFLVGLVAPYSASMSATILHLVPGHCEGSLQDRPWLRNPFNSIHALALANLGELVSGAAVMGAIEAQVRNHRKARGIVSGLRTIYLVKARGPITATSTVVLPTSPGRHAVKARAVLRNTKGDTVAEFEADWTVHFE
eukprot:m.13928 g.13928  ORF g.13928 m.13928 type:complete len:201 (+) comp6308_c0_seq2:37-639(+)